MTGREKQESGEGEGEQREKGPRKRKRVSVRKRVKRPRRRAQDRAKASRDSSDSSGSKDQTTSDLAQNLPHIELADRDLADCVFSDDEEKVTFLEENNATCGHLMCQHVDDHMRSHNESNSESVSVERDGDSESISSVDHTYARPQSSNSSRPETSMSVGSPDATHKDGLFDFDVPQEPTSSMSTPTMETGASPESQGEIGLDTALPTAEEVRTGQTVVGSVNIDVEHIPPMDLIFSGVSLLRNLLPSNWVVIADRCGYHLLLISDGVIKTVQRDVHISFNGESNITVHCRALPIADTLLSAVELPKVKLEMDTKEEFCKRALSIVQVVSQYKICEGANHQETRSVWENIPNAFIDVNPYLEKSYSETCRSMSCSFLIKHGKNLRCKSCHIVMLSLRRRSASLLSDFPHPSTPDIHLSRDQITSKMKAQSEEIKKKTSKIFYLTGKVAKLLEDDGVDVDSDLGEDLNDILAKAQLSDLQRMFWREQLMCSGKSDPRAHRWHPSMIRLALHLKMTSSAAYNALRDSGVIKLPCNRTLYDYSHAFDPQAGISDGMLKIAASKVSKMQYDHQKYVCLIFDEMYISKNLVYRQSDGNMVGYVHLDQVEKEMYKFDNYLSGKESELEVPVASKMLAFMVKGITSSLKCVVAAYPVNTLTKDILFSRTWEVISRLERALIRVLCLVCDGSSINRAFIDMHSAFTEGCRVIFDTLNWCSPESRVLFFMSDVAHLIKTIRNCFFNSGEGPKKTRRMMFNGEKIEWKTIVRLYLSYKQCGLRKSFKLNSQNVFLNSYSCMSVKHAVTVLSETVATDIELQNWPGTKETVKFIRRWNQFFDCLNGLHSQEHIRKKNKNLAPYRDVKDDRFDWLLSCIEHLEEWRRQASMLHVTSKDQEKVMLSYQTQNGIEMSIRGFIGATRFMLQEGAKFVMPRDFSQDHLENYFSRQRGRGGGSGNPNASQFLSQQVAIGLHSNLGFSKKGANVQGESPGMKITLEPVAKRRKPRKKS